MKMRRLLVIFGLLTVFGMAVISTVAMSTNTTSSIMADGEEYGDGG